jgi:hypothetical protein
LDGGLEILAGRGRRALHLEEQVVQFNHGPGGQRAILRSLLDDLGDFGLQRAEAQAVNARRV